MQNGNVVWVAFWISRSIEIPKTIVFSIVSRKILAHDVVTMRGARGGENAPLIISIPSPIVKAAKYKKGEKIQIYTDGERTYLERLAEPKL